SALSTWESWPTQTFSSVPTPTRISVATAIPMLTKHKPASAKPPAVRKSFYILDQLANFFQRSFDLDDLLGYLHVACLRAHRVRLAEHLLRQKLQLAARAFLLFHDLLEMSQMRRQTNHLFSNVAALGKDRHLTDKIITVDLNVVFAQDRLHPLKEAVAKARHHLRDQLADYVEMPGDRVAIAQELLPHCVALFLAHPLQLLERLL